MANETTAAPDSGDGTSEDKDAMTSIAGQIRFLSTGDRAALRRIYLKQSRAAEGVVVKLLHGAKIPQAVYDLDFERWQLIAHFAATLAGTGAIHAHAENRRLGAALHAAGLSENRLLRLTAVRGPSLIDQIALTARVLARAGQVPVNLWTAFNLAGDHTARAEKARIRIAQDFYAASARSGKGDIQ